MESINFHLISFNALKLNDWVDLNGMEAKAQQISFLSSINKSNSIQFSTKPNFFGLCWLNWRIAVDEEEKRVCGAQFRPSIKEISFLLIMGGAAKPFKFNSFSINPSILKEWVDEKNEFDWAAAYNAHFTMFNFMNFTFVSLIPQKKNSIIKHSSIPVINYCYNIILRFLFNKAKNERNELFLKREVNGLNGLIWAGATLIHKWMDSRSWL